MFCRCRPRPVGTDYGTTLKPHFRTLYVAADGHAYRDVLGGPLQSLPGMILDFLKWGFKVVAHIPRKDALVFRDMDLILVQFLENTVPGLMESTRVHKLGLVEANPLMAMQIKDMIEMSRSHVLHWYFLAYWAKFRMYDK